MNPEQERLEKLKARKQQLEKQIKQEAQKMNDAERKARARKLIELGGLIELAGLAQIDKAILLGSCLELAETLNNSDPRVKDYIQELSRTGNAAFARREAEKAAKAVSKGGK